MGAEAQRDPEPHERFDAAAEAYGRARPPYPRELVDWLAATARLTEGDAVLDLGAGTGDLTVRLIEAGLAVHAVEPSRRMRALLRARLPAIEVCGDRAEELGTVADDRFDLVTAANSLHWLEPVQTYAQIRRVLRAGGHLGVIWHLPDRGDELQARLWRLVEDLHAGAAPYPGPVPGGDPGWDGLFDEVGSASYGLVHRLPRALLPDYIGSWSGVANLEPAARTELLAEVRVWTVPEIVELPFRIEAVVARRAGD